MVELNAEPAAFRWREADGGCQYQRGISLCVHASPSSR